MCIRDSPGAVDSDLLARLEYHCLEWRLFPRRHPGAGTPQCRGDRYPAGARQLGRDAADNLSWQVSIAPYEFGDPAWELPPDAFLVTSAVSWDRGNDKQRRISLTSLRLSDLSDSTDSGTGEAAASKSGNKTR